MAHVAGRRSFFGSPVAAEPLGESRDSGVRRVARAVLPNEEVDRPASQRPTAPAPVCAVIDESSETGRAYAKIATGKFPIAVVPEGIESPDSVTARATRDLLMALGSLDRTPVLTRALDDLRSATLDPRQAFVLSLVDGHTSITSIIDASPMPMHKVLLCLNDLLAHGLIGFSSQVTAYSQVRR